MNVEQHAEIVRRYLTRVAAGDHSAAVELVRQDIRVLIPVELPYGGTWIGRDNLLQLLSEAQRAWSGRTAPTGHLPLAGVGNRVFHECEFSGTLVHTGQRVTMYCTEVFEFCEGLISEIRQYFSDPAILVGP
jgi:ketosteroid isomerase-like protein